MPSRAASLASRSSHSRISTRPALARVFVNGGSWLTSSNRGLIRIGRPWNASARKWWPPLAGPCTQALASTLPMSGTQCVRTLRPRRRRRASTRARSTIVSFTILFAVSFVVGLGFLALLNHVLPESCCDRGVTAVRLVAANLWIVTWTVAMRWACLRLQRRSKASRRGGQTEGAPSRGGMAQQDDWRPQGLEGYLAGVETLPAAVQAVQRELGTNGSRGWSHLSGTRSMRSRRQDLTESRSACAGWSVGADEGIEDAARLLTERP